MKYYFDIGSSTIKMYQYKGKKLEQIEEKSILFKNFFNEIDGISTNNYNNLVRYCKELKEKYKLAKINTSIYATGIWRKIPSMQLENLKADFKAMDLDFQVISHDEENYYFQKAMQGIYNNKKVLMVNMGGKTTELVVIAKGNVVNKINLTVGVADILNQYPKINEPEADIKLEEAVKYAGSLITEKIDFKCDCAIHTGGELRFQKLAGYKLVPNTIFQDGIHTHMVSYDDFKEKNKELLYHTTIEQLYNLMPSNPKWMDGAKAGVILGQAIFEKAKVPYIIPSDLNLIHGVIKCEK